MNSKAILFILYFSCISLPLFAQDKITLKNMHEKKWQQYIDEHIKIGNDVKVVDKILNDFTRDKIIMPLGGSGSYYKYYLIDDFIQIRADFDVNDTLIRIPIIEPLQKFRKFPDGTGVADADSTKNFSQSSWLKNP
jgi:hypothetical protein